LKNRTELNNKKMAKNHKKGDGVKLVGSPSDLINALLKDPTERKEALNQITGHGPKHKQVLDALLLKRLYKLVKAVEENTGRHFIEQKGLPLTVGKDDDEMLLPLPIPVNISSGFNKKKIVKAISKAPAHEALTFTMSLHVIEWAINSMTTPPRAKNKNQVEATTRRKLKIDNTDLSKINLELDGVAHK
jgi:hypothetical protein